MRQNDANSLTHYGVLGMHWGVQKAEYLSGRSTRNRTLANAHRTASQAHATGSASGMHKHSGLPAKLALSKGLSVKYHDINASRHAELAKRYDELARNTFHKPYDSRNKPLHLSMFEKVALTVAGVTAASLLKPTVDLFGERIMLYVKSKAFKTVTKVVTKSAAELAKEALGG